MENVETSKKTKVKGITLIECIISILVLGIAGLIMAEVGSVSSRVMLETNHLNNKTNAEAPVALVRDNQWKDKGGTQIEPVETGIVITVSGASGGSSTHTVSRYSTNVVADDYQQAVTEITTDDAGNEVDVVLEQRLARTHMNGDLEFYVFETEPTT